MGASNTTGMIAAALAGGIVGALILVFAYFIGIALVGAGLGALVAHFGWSYVRPGDPPALAVIGWRSSAPSARWCCSATSSSCPPPSAARGR